MSDTDFAVAMQEVPYTQERSFNMIHVTVRIPHDPDIEAKLGRLSVIALAMGGSLSIEEWVVPSPTPVMGDITAGDRDRDSGPVPTVGVKARRANGGD